jgi:adenylate cyclase
MRRDEEEVIAGFLEVWALVEDREDVYVRAARIAGDGIRRLDLATLDLFDELGGAPPPRLRRGLPLEEAVLPSHLISTVTEQLFVWLHRRHTENEVFERIVDRLEQTLAGAGRRERQRVEPPAVAFVDLTGYTQLAASAGDHDAVRAATLLHSLALDAARVHNGRVVKLLGDGVVLRYPSAREAVSSVAALMREIARAGLPPAHAGIAAGPIIARDGDIYGHTVNLAARIASHASAGELLVHTDISESVKEEGFEQEDAGEASLKGIVEPVQLSRVRLPRPS